MIDDALTALGPSGPERSFWFVPGRVEVLGKHTDYAGGRSLLAAAERGFCVAAASGPEPCLRIFDVGRGELAELSLAPDAPLPAVPWAPYAAAVARRLSRDFPGLQGGAHVALISDLPPAAGLSSSSALVVALFTALASALRLEKREDYRAAFSSAEELAGYLGSVESGRRFGRFPGEPGGGAFIGSEDHTAILCCRAGCLSQYAFVPVRHERTVALPAGWTFVIAASGVAADKAGEVRERYNFLARSAEALRQIAGGSESLFDALGPDGAGAAAMREALSKARHPEFPAEFLRERFEQLFEECVRIIPAAADALAAGDVRAIGPLVARSQELAEQVLGNQIPQTTFLARTAREAGAAAASAFGAGFGGSVWALLAEEDATAFRDRWRESYVRAYPDSAAQSDFFTTRAGPSLQRL
jgi:galactokinase